MLFVLSLSSSNADDELAKIASRLSKTVITNGLFAQEKQLKILHKPLLSTGVFTYHQRQGLIWKTLTPISSLLILNDQRLLTAQHEQAAPPGFGNVFKALFGGELQRLNDDFTAVGELLPTSWRLQLTPKEALLGKLVNSMVLTGDTELRYLEIQETIGNVTRIRFEQITHPEHLSLEQQADFERLSR